MTAQLIENLSMADYAALPAIGSHGLGTILDKSPAHFRFSEREETEAMALGTALHTLVLEPAAFDATYHAMPVNRPPQNTNLGKRAILTPEEFAATVYLADIPEPTGKGSGQIKNVVKAEAGKRCIVWADEKSELEDLRNQIWANPPAPGKKILWADEMETIRGQRNKIWTWRDDREGWGLADILRGAAFEVSVLWTDEETGVACKARFDILKETAKGAIIADVKRCRDSSPGWFCRNWWRLGYHRQAGFYREACRQLGIDFFRFLFIPVEPSRPWECTVQAPSEREMDIGMAHCRAALRTYAKCLETNEWPGYARGVHSLTLPPFIDESTAAIPEED